MMRTNLQVQLNGTLPPDGRWSQCAPVLIHRPALHLVLHVAPQQQEDNHGKQGEDDDNPDDDHGEDDIREPGRGHRGPHVVRVGRADVARDRGGEGRGRLARRIGGSQFGVEKVKH